MLRLHRAKRGENPAGSYDEAADVEQRLIQHVLAIIFMVTAPVSSAFSAPYAAVVMDARDGTVYHSRNADTRLHPASLTKMMTLYIAFQAVERGEISLDTKVTISANAAAEPPSKLGLRRGQKIKLRYLIRAAAIKSANDAATAIGEAISGSEKAFARRMTRTAEALGMKKTTFRNAHGLTNRTHLSTARDMTILGRHMIYDYPDYYNLFSRRQAETTVKTVRNTNRRFLSAYKGADGIKTGFTNAAGFNLVASAKRGRERIIATVFGGRSTASRNKRVAELLNMGFKRAPSSVNYVKPKLPDYKYSANGGIVGKTTRQMTAVKKSLHPKMRPSDDASVVEQVLNELATTSKKIIVKVPKIEILKYSAIAPKDKTASPKARPSRFLSTTKPTQTKTVARLAIQAEGNWTISIGKYQSKGSAERILLRTALAEMGTLDGASRVIKTRTTGFEALFKGLTRERADLTCRRLHARQLACILVAPQ